VEAGGFVVDGPEQIRALLDDPCPWLGAHAAQDGLGDHVGRVGGPTRPVAKRVSSSACFR